MVKLKLFGVSNAALLTHVLLVKSDINQVCANCSLDEKTCALRKGVGKNLWPEVAVNSYFAHINHQKKLSPSHLIKNRHISH